MPRSSEITNLHHGDVIGASYVMTVAVLNDGSAAVTVTAACPGSTVNPTSGHNIPGGATTATEVEFTLTHSAPGGDETVTVAMQEGTTPIPTGGDAVEDVDVVIEGKRITIDRDILIADGNGFKIERLAKLTSVQAGFYGGTYDPTGHNNVSVLVLVQRMRKDNNKKRYKTIAASVAQLFVVGGVNPARRWQAELPQVNQPNNGRLVIRVLLLRQNGKVLQTTGYPNP